MKKLIQTTAITFCFLLATAGLANAQDNSRGTAMGVGAETMLVPLGAGGGGFPVAGIGGAAEFVYDAGPFHIDGLLMYQSQANTYSAFGLGGRFFYVLHSGASADLSVGGGLAIISFSPNGGNSDTDILLDGGAKIRAFLSNNVALHTTLGLSFYLPGADNAENSLGLSARLLGNIGITYFFR